MVATATEEATKDWRSFTINIELHLSRRHIGPWALDKVVLVPSTSQLVLRAFHKHIDGKLHRGQHGVPRVETTPSGYERTVGCGTNGGDISLAEVLAIARLMRA